VQFISLLGLLMESVFKGLGGGNFCGILVGDCGGWPFDKVEYCREFLFAGNLIDYSGI
jgi:hypothetical protein